MLACSLQNSRYLAVNVDKSARDAGLHPKLLSNLLELDTPYALQVLRPMIAEFVQINRTRPILEVDRVRKRIAYVSGSARFVVQRPITTVAGFDRSSKELRTLSPGTIVDVVELRKDSTGQTRVRLAGAGGWIALAFPNGTALLKPLPLPPPPAEGDLDAATEYAELLGRRCSTQECGQLLDKKRVEAIVRLGRQVKATTGDGGMLARLVVTGWGHRLAESVSSRRILTDKSEAAAPMTTRIYCDAVCGSDVVCLVTSKNRFVCLIMRCAVGANVRLCLG
eukprot:SAG31_NODE_6164_length_2142_cov_4.426334_2_plen_280_part_00